MIETERLIMRPWKERDRAPYAAISRDPAVMEYLGPVQSRAESDTAIDRMIAVQEKLGYCLWAVERREDGALLGFCGLKPGAPDTPIADDVEIGWRFGRGHWGQGYAREAAQASLAWGWANTDAPRIVAITVLANTRSWGLMERLGMVRAANEDFDHPTVADKSPLKRHIVYRIGRP